MAEAHVIINVGPIPIVHGNGLSGQHTIPARGEDGSFGILVVYPTPEIQDIGDQRRTVHWLKSLPLAKDIAGERSEYGNYAKWGILRCAAEADLPKELLSAIEEEMEFLNANIPEVKYVKKDGVMCAINVEDSETKRAKINLSKKVQAERKKFEAHCRTLVTKEEVAKAKQRMLAEWARMVSDADTLWAGPEDSKRNISELAKFACRELGLERPWCYIAVQQFPCPGCGKPCREGVITCGSCGAVFDKEFAEYAKMSNAEKARSLYPDRYREPEPIGAKK